MRVDDPAADSDELAAKANAADAFDASPLRQALVSLVAIKIAGIALVVDVAGLQAFDLPKSLFSRALEWLLAGLIVASLARYGPQIIPRSVMHLAIGAVVVASGISAAFAQDRYRALFGDWDRFLGLTFVIDMAVLYLAIACAFRHSSDWAILGLALAFAATVVLGYGTIQYLGLDPITWTDPTRRPFSTFGNPDHLGHFLSIGFGVSAGITALGPFRPALRAASALLAVAIAVAAAVVATRGTFLAMTAVGLAIPALLLWTGGVTRRALIQAGSALIFACVLLSAIVLLSPLGERVRVSGMADPARVVLFDGAFRTFLARPITGYGLDGLGVAFPQHRPPGTSDVLSGEAPNAAHDWILQTAATSGLVGLVALLSALAFYVLSSLVALRDTRRGSIVGVALLASLGYWTHALVAVGSISVDWAGWTCFGVLAATRGGRVAFRSGRCPMRLAALGAVTIAFVGATTGAAAFLANRDAWLAESHVATPDGIAYALSATRRDPGRAEYWRWLGAAYASAARWPEAVAADKEAIARAAHDWTLWAQLAGAHLGEARAGDSGAPSAAIAAARQAVSADPELAVTHGFLAMTARVVGDYDLALLAVANAARRTGLPTYDDLAAESAAQATTVAEARAPLEAALQRRDGASLRVALARVTLKLGDYDAAVRHARRALELDPGDADARELLRLLSAL